VGIPQTPQDLRAEDGSNPRHRRHDASRIRLGEEDRDPLVEILELVAEAKRQPCLDRDVLGPSPEVKRLGLVRRTEVLRNG
jgi:hypothetical protein